MQDTDSPASFTDTAGRSWNLTLDVATVKAVKKRAGVDLLDLEKGLPVQLRENPVLLVDALWVIVEPQAGDCTDEGFGRALGGDTLDAAAAALVQGLIDFFPSSRRPLLLKALGKTQEAETGLVRRHEMMLQDLDVETLLDRAGIRGEPSTSSPAPPESEIRGL